MKKTVLFLFIVGFSLTDSRASVLRAEEPAKSQPQITLTQQSIRDQVKVLRKQRYDQMPYLDRNIIRSEIHKNTLRGKNAFLKEAQDKGLPQILGRSMEVYLPVRASRERIALVQRRVLFAIRKLFPDAKFEYDDKLGSLSGVPFNSRRYRFSFRQPVFRGGVLWNTLLKEKANLEAEHQDYESIVDDLVKEVSEAYFELNRTTATYEDQEKTQAGMKRLAGISKQKYSGQLISEIEYLNVQSLAGQIEYDHETAKQELELAKLGLQKYLDLSNNDPLAIVPLYDVNEMIEKERATDAGNLNSAGQENSKFKGEIRTPDLNALVDLAYQHRAKLRYEASKLNAARLDEKIQWGALLPQADVVMEFGKLSEAYTSLAWHPEYEREFLMAVEFKWNLGGNNIEYKFANDERAKSVSAFLQGSGTQISSNSFSVGLWDGLQSFVSTKDAEVAKLEQISALDKAEKEVVHDVKDAYYDYQKANIRVKSALHRVDYQERVTRLKQHKLEKNEIPISEYLEEEINYLEALSTLHKAFADYFTAKVKLNHAIGMRNYLPLEGWYGSEPGIARTPATGTKARTPETKKPA